MPVEYQSKMTSDDYPEGYWERSEGSNYTNYGDDPGWSVVMDVMENYMHPDDAIIEVACAKGYFVKAARDRHYFARGFDISEYAIKTAHPSVRPWVQVANAVNMPYPENEADVMFAFEFMEHVYLNEVNQVIDEIKRVLRNDGLLVMKIGLTWDELNPNPHKDNPQLAGHHQQHDKTHYNNQVRQWWEDKFNECGLTQRKDIEQALDEAFKNRDWSGRFFVYQRGNECHT